MYWNGESCGYIQSHKAYTWSSSDIQTIWNTTKKAGVHCDTAFVSCEHTQSSQDNSSFCDAVCICTLCPTHHIISTGPPIQLVWLHPLNQQWRLWRLDCHIFWRGGDSCTLNNIYKCHIIQALTSKYTVLRTYSSTVVAWYTAREDARIDWIRVLYCCI